MKAVGYPDDSIQSFIDPWWQKDAAPSLCPGRLIWHFAPYFNQTEQKFTPTARFDPRDHTTAQYRVEPLRIHQKSEATGLPVAALPLTNGEVYLLRKAKRRPAVVLAGASTPMPKKPTGAASWMYTATMLVAPLYGGDQDGTRSGWRPDLVEAIRHCRWPQYFYEQLPLGKGPAESIMRLDNVHPIGRHQDCYELTDYRLSDNALAIVHDYWRWMNTGMLVENSELHAIVATLHETFP